MLFEEIAYGPIRSRRLGVSLGMNVMPQHSKLCSFDCIYCECGFNGGIGESQKSVQRTKGEGQRLLPSREEVREALEKKLQALQAEGVTPDVITFSGNGEPTMHPDFEAIIADTCRLRNQYCPSAKVSVLSNSTQLHRADVVRALQMADNRIMKLDSAITATMRMIDQPVNEQLTAEKIMEQLKVFNGHFTLQTCFLKGTILHGNPNREGHYLLGPIDNTTKEELAAWYAAVEALRPEQIMIYVIDRKTPVETLEKISKEEMEAIAQPLREKGYNVSVSA